MTVADAEEPLLDGNVTAGIVRVGDTVRRPATASSASVDALLLHLEAVGFTGAPRALGYDSQGRQVLTYVEGDVSPDPADLTAARLASVGAVIRDFHDAVVTFEPPEHAVWNVVIGPDTEEMVCHNDLAPWNLVRSQRALTFIDWDGAGPASRLWDLAYAAHGFVPMAPTSGLGDDQAAARLRALVDGYRLDEPDRQRLVDLLEPRVTSMVDLLDDGHLRGIDPWARLWDDGHRQAWAADADYVRARRSTWAAALLA